MQINKVDSTSTFGAQLKLFGVNKRHWNLKSNELKQLASKAEEIGTPKDVVLFEIGKFGAFDNTKEMLSNNLDNIEGPLWGCYRNIKSYFTMGDGSHQIQLSDYNEGSFDNLKYPFKIMQNWLNTLAKHFPNNVRAEHKSQETEKLKKFIDAYDKNAYKVSDYLFAEGDTKKIVKHIKELETIKEAAEYDMIDFKSLDKEYEKKAGDILCNGQILTSAYVKNIIKRAHFLSAEKCLETRKNPAEYAKLKAKEEALLEMFLEE